MSLCAEITVPRGETALGWALSDLDVRVEFDPLVPTDDHYLPYLWVDAAQEAIDQFEDRLATVDAVTSVSTLQERGSTRLYWLDWDAPSDGVFGAASRSEASIKRAVGTADGWGLRVQGVDRNSLASFRDECTAHSIPFTLERLREPRPTVNRGTKVTDPQREALRLAHETGYYDVPRRAELDTLGATLDVSRQAVSHRLRRGTKRLVEEVVLDPSDLLEERIDAAGLQAAGDGRR